jgi:hypothetical protein
LDHFHALSSTPTRRRSIARSALAASILLGCGSAERRELRRDGLDLGPPRRRLGPRLLLALALVAAGSVEVTNASFP